MMDTDSPNEDIGLHSVKSARNIRYRGVPGNYRIENVPGTTLIANSLPAGNNECVGSFYDNLKQRIFYFNYNSNLTHGIYIIDLSANTISPLLVTGAGTNGNIFLFTLDEPIFAVKMLYGDIDQGDTLYYNNCQKKPQQINIERTLAATYGVMTTDFLEVIKYPANRPPYVIYGDDNTVTVNTLRKKLFKFKIRYIYFSREKSVTSIQSEVPIPIGYLDTAIDKDPTKNCKISVVYETGAADVEKIEILGAVTGKSDANQILDPNQFSDFFLIQAINKSQAGLGNNDLATFEFKNDQVYLEIDPEDSIQIQDFVPLQANAMEFLNGNNLIYAGITEGFNSVPLLGSISGSSIAEQNTQLRYIFVGTQSGDSAFGTGNIHAVAIGSLASSNIGDTFNIITTNQTISFTVASTVIANVITGLSAAAVIAGFTIVSSDSNNLVIIKSGESLQRIYTTQFVVPAIQNSYAHNWNDREAYGIQYFDKGGRTIGSVTNTGFTVQTANYTETTGVANIPDVSMSISSRPPDTAFYYSIGRSKSLAKQKYLYWISHDTYKDTEFAYISIANLNFFIAINPDSKFLAYDFSAGDRIRFIKILSGSVNTIYTNQDFEIVGQVFNPLITGIQKSGQYLKIALPATSGTFDFGTAAFFNYFIELYTPALSVANDLNKYYEWGERFTIGNPTLTTRYHQGQIQNQTSNLSQPATFEFKKGQSYYRKRKISAGNAAKWDITQQNAVAGLGRYTPALTLRENTVDSTLFTVQSTSVFRGVSPAQNSNFAIFKVNTGANAVFNVGGIINFRNNNNEALMEFAVQVFDGTASLTTIPLGSISNVVGGTDYTISLNTSFTFPAGTNRAYFNMPTIFRGTISGFITIEESAKVYNIGIMDQNFSDYFQSSASPNGRAFVADPEAKRVYNSVLLRWGLPNILNTNINQISRFKYLNFDEVDNTKGDIEVLSTEDRMLNVLQRRACGWYGIYSKILQDNDGGNVLSTTDEILTKNNIQYLKGEYGIGNQKWSFAKGKSGYYFTDPVRGYQVRRSGDGLIPLNELYKGQYLLRNLITPYSKPYIQPNGSRAKIIGYYDFFEEEYDAILQAGTYAGNTLTAESFAFNETRNAYTDFKDLIPEWITSAKDRIYAWKSGAAYIQNDEVNWCKFFGVQYFPSVTLVFNDKEAVKKVFDALAYQGNQIWVADTVGDINTSMINPQTGLRQMSQLKEVDFEIQENVRYAALLRDGNSLSDIRLAIVEGDFLNGNWCEIKLTYKGSNFAYIYGVYLLSQSSPRTF